MRMPLASLQALGSQPLLGDMAPAWGPTPSLSAAKGVCLPPKEVMAIMQWVVMQSRDEAPGSLRWWPDPLLDGTCRGQDELNELLRYAENCWPIPRSNPQLPVWSAAVFILRWLSLLPEPVLTSSTVEEFARTGEALEAVRSMPSLTRCVVLCITSLFAQLSQRHSDACSDVPHRLASSLTHQVPAKASAEQLISALLVIFREDSAWPPTAHLSASL